MRHCGLFELVRILLSDAVDNAADLKSAVVMADIGLDRACNAAIPDIPFQRCLDSLRVHSRVVNRHLVYDDV